MFKLKIVSTVFLFLFLQLGVLVQLPSSQAYAWCCAACGSLTCGLCFCPGTNGCKSCHSGDTDPVQSTAVINKTTADIRAVRNLDAADRVMHLTKVGDCARRSFALRVLGNAGESLKVASFSFGKENMHDSNVLLTAANAER